MDCDRVNALKEKDNLLEEREGLNLVLNAKTKHRGIQAKLEDKLKDSKCFIQVRNVTPETRGAMCPAM